jgi:hypothetical protein
MLFQILRLLALGLVGLTVLYVIVSIYSRSVRREKLEKRWEEEGRPGDREAYVAEGLARYDGSFRRKLILAIYVVPLLATGVTIYVMNFL